MHTDSRDKRLDVALPKKQVENSPNIATDKPFPGSTNSRTLGITGMGIIGIVLICGLVRLPGWLPYSKNCFHGSAGVANREIFGGFASAEYQAVTGYHIQASGGQIGHADGFIVDDEDWSIRYIEVATKNWWPGKKVLVSPAWIERLRREGSTVSSASRGMPSPP